MMPIGAGPWNPWPPTDTSVDTSGMTPGQLAAFHWLTMYQGLPAVAARSMAVNPSYEDGRQPEGVWPYSYAGRDKEEAAGKPDSEGNNWFAQHMFNKMWFGNRQQQPISYQPGGDLSPQMQLLQYFMQNGGRPGAQNPLLQMAGDVYGFGLPRDQMNIQRATPTPPWPPNNPFPFDMYSGQRGGPPVDFSYPPARPMVPANQAMLSPFLLNYSQG